MVIIKKSIGMPTKRSSPYSRRARQSRESDLHQSRFPTQPQDHRSFPAVRARVYFFKCSSYSCKNLHAQYVLCNITIVLVFILSFFLLQMYPPTWSFWPHRIFLGSRFPNIICNRIASQFILNAQQKKNAKTHGSTFHFKFLLGSALPSAQCSCLTMHIICFTPQCNAFHYQP